MTRHVDPLELFGLLVDSSAIVDSAELPREPGASEDITIGPLLVPGSRTPGEGRGESAGLLGSVRTVRRPLLPGDVRSSVRRYRMRVRRMPDTSTAERLPSARSLVHTLMGHAQERSGLDLADQVVRHGKQTSPV